MAEKDVSRSGPSRVQLVLVIHNHQPVGNFDHVIQRACDQAYLPFLRLLQQFPRLRIGLHTSGCLWEWLEANRPEYGELVDDLLAAGQLELLGGGMYEPILPVLPDRDALWQLQRMSSFLFKRFGFEPTGMWCPERVWEPHLPKVIYDAGLSYTLLDDYHFRSSANAQQIATEYFLTEHAGALTALLPISKKLRYTIPFQPVEKTIDYLRELASEASAAAGTPLVVFGDDGEKFGIWPDTYEWVYTKGWLQKFFTALNDNLDWIDLVLPGEVPARRRPAGKVFIPCSSYSEMGEWTRVDPLAPADAPPGFWRNYLSKYPESNAMYRRMLAVSEQLERARELGKSDRELAAAADDLGRAQCNCAYWHGVFGGLYLNYLRQAVNFHTLRSENELRRICPELRGKTVSSEDHDGLGWPQYILENKRLSAVLDPGHGLCLTRLDYRPTCFAWADVLARRREAYHSKVEEAHLASAAEHASIHDRIIFKEAGLQERLIVDEHPRVSFTTFFADIRDPEQLLSVASGNDGVHLAHQDYTVAIEQAHEDEQQVSGRAAFAGGAIDKSCRVHAGGLQFSLKLAAGALPAQKQDFFVEFNFTLLTDSAENRYLLAGDDRQEVGAAAQWRDLKQLSLVDGWQKLALVLRTEHARRVLYYPVYTVSSSEGGFEKTYQGSCILLAYHPLALLEGIGISLAIEEMD